MIVVDLGCAEHQGEGSITQLLERFHPRVFYGFDPHPGAGEIWVNKGLLPPQLIIEEKAAWTYDGFIGFREAGLRSRVGEAEGPMAVPCFDLAAFVAGLPADEELVVKMDVEGAEKPLLEHLIAKGADSRIGLLLVEWHDDREFVEPYDRADLIARLTCRVEEWH